MADKQVIPNPVVADDNGQLVLVNTTKPYPVKIINGFVCCAECGYWQGFHSKGCSHYVGEESDRKQIWQKA